MERASVLKGALLAFLGVFFVAAPLFAGVTGKIEGVVTDTKTGKAVPFANVAIPTLLRGAQTDEKGYYFIINVPAGRYNVKANIIGYDSVVRQDVAIIPDFTTTLNFQLNSTTATTVAEQLVSGERPLIQRDAVGTTRAVSGAEIKALPTRGYRDAVAQGAGVVTQGRYSADTEAQNAPSLYIRGGRSNSVAYYVDGFSTQDALTGISTSSINQNAVEEVTTLVGGFSAEYGRVSSGIVNVITKEGGKEYKGSLETLTDYGTGSWLGTHVYGNLVYNGSLSGPVLGSDKLAFFVAGEARNNRDRAPRPDISLPTGLANPDSLNAHVGRLENNQLVGQTYQGKLSWKPTPLTNARFSFLGSRDLWSRYQNEYQFNIAHTPYYHDVGSNMSLAVNRTFNERSFLYGGVSYNFTERTRGDGVYRDDLLSYSQGLREGKTNPLYINNSDFLAPGHVWDDYFHRKSSYLGFKLDYTNQTSRHHTIKMGVDGQRHTLRFYNHLFPTALGRTDYTNNDQVSYGFDPFGRETDADFLPDLKDSLGILVLNSNRMIANRNKAKHPVEAAAYLQDKIEYEGMIAQIGMRWDHLDARTQRLVDPANPLGAAGDSLRLEPSTAHDKLSPRLGVSFPVTEKTDFRFNYGLFYQLPDLQNLYTNYDYLTYKVKIGGYYYPFGNPNLEPERTTQMEMGVSQQLGQHGALDVAMWYKDIQGLVQVKSQPSTPNQFATFRNADFGTLRGLDLSYTARRVTHFSGNAAYSLSWARGTGSTPQSQRNIAWTASQEPKIIAALDFDVRHKFSLNLDYRSPVRKDEGGIQNLWADCGLNMIFSAQSGTPYTPVKIYDEVTQLAVSNSVIGDLNSRYKPWIYALDLKATKTIKLGSDRAVDLQVYVYNVLNRLNPTTVYLGTGDPFVTGYLNTDPGKKLGDSQVVFYELAQRNPLNLDNPRMVRIGAVMNF